MNIAALTKKTRRQIAIEELMESRMVKNWAVGECLAYGIQPNSPQGQEFIQSKSRKIAEKLLR